MAAVDIVKAWGRFTSNKVLKTWASLTCVVKLGRLAPLEIVGCVPSCLALRVIVGQLGHLTSLVLDLLGCQVSLETDDGLVSVASLVNGGLLVYVASLVSGGLLVYLASLVIMSLLPIYRLV